MGYFTDDWIPLFIEGKTIKQIKNDKFFTYIIFDNGESLRLYADKSKRGYIIVTTPFDKDGNVKQTTAIYKGE